MQHINAILFVPLLLFILITFSIYYLFNNTKAASPWNKKKSSSPPSPPRLPLIGNLHQLGSLPHRSLRNLSNKLGPVMFLRFGRVPAIVVSSAEAAREVFKTHDLVFSSRPHSTMNDRLFYGSRDVTFTPYGEYWRQMRRISIVHLFNLKRVQSFRPVRQEEVALMVEKIRASPGPINLSETIVGLTTDLICRAAFGRKYHSKSDEGGIGQLFAELFFLLGKNHIGDFIPWLSWIDSLSGLDARVRRCFIEFDTVINKILEDHQLLRVNNYQGLEDDSHQDFVDVLMSLEANDVDKVGISLERNSIKALLMDVFTAGTDTSFAVLEWTMAELIRHPEALKKVQEEVRRAAIPNGCIEEESIEWMTYMKAVIKEALRLHPPAPLLIPRETTQDVQLCGYEIPARTRVIINAWAIGRDPRSWERPEDFWPDRFLNSSVDFRGQDFQFIPFGAGRRGCPGIGFGISTIEMALANLLHYFDWEFPGSLERADVLDMAEASGLTSHMKSSLILVAKPRVHY